MKLLTFAGIIYLIYVWFIKPKSDLSSDKKQSIAQEEEAFMTIKIKKKKTAQQDRNDDEYIDYQEVK